MGPQKVSDQGPWKAGPRSKGVTAEEAESWKGNGAIQKTCPWTLSCGRGGGNSERGHRSPRRGARGQLGSKLGKGWRARCWLVWQTHVRCSESETGKGKSGRPQKPRQSPGQPCLPAWPQMSTGAFLQKDRC